MKLRFKKLIPDKKYHHVRTHMQPRRFIYPVREWGIGLALGGFLFLILATYGGVAFYIQYTNINTPPVSDESVINYRGKDVAPLLEMFTAKEAHFNELRGVAVASNTPEVIPENIAPLDDTEESDAPPLAPDLIQQ